MEYEKIPNKLTLDAPPAINFEDYPSIEYHIKGQDNKQYNIKIYQSEKSIIFLTNEINDILNIKYKIELNLEEFHNLNRIFRQYISVEELFTLYFKSLKEHKIIINKQDKNIKLSLLIEFRGQKEEISFEADVSVLDAVYDRFGDSVRVMNYGNNKALCKVEVQIGRPLITWFIGFGSALKVKSPQSVIDQIVELIDESTKNYKQ